MHMRPADTRLSLTGNGLMYKTINRQRHGHNKMYGKVNGKGKIHPRRRHGGPEGRVEDV